MAQGDILPPVRMLRHDFRMPESQTPSLTGAATVANRFSVRTGTVLECSHSKVLVSKMGNCHLPAPVQSEGGKQHEAAPGPPGDAENGLVPGAPNQGGMV